MVVNFKDLHFYYLNYEGYTDRRVKMEEMLSGWGVGYTRIPNNISLPLRQNRIAMGHIKLLEYAINENRFPFVVMDDDIKPINNIPSTIKIPEQASFIFLGGSLYDCGGIKPNMYITEYNEDFYRVYYMLSLTPVVIPNSESANKIKKFIQESLETSEFFDVTITMQSKELIYLTPKDGPYFYQDNYNEHVTKFLWRDTLGEYLHSI